MATDIKKIITIDPGESTKTIKQLREEINELRKSQADLAIGSEEYDKVTRNLANSQAELNAVMYDAKTRADAADGSYNALTKQLKQLQQQWKATGDAAERDSIGVQMKFINARLKDLDASVGNYSRNVGNYTNAIQAAFAGAGGAVSGMVNPIRNVNNAFNLLKANPIMAVLSGLLLVVNNVSAAIKRSEESSDKLNGALAGLKAPALVVKRIFEDLAQVFAGFIAGLDKLVTKFGRTKLGQVLGLDKVISDVSKAREDLKDIDARQRQLDKDRVAFIRTESDLRRRVSELRLQAADHTKSEEERQKALNKAIDIEAAIGRQKYQLAKREYEIVRDRNKLAASSRKDREAEARAYAAMNEALTEMNSKQVRMTANASSLEKSITSATEKLDEADRKRAEGIYQRLLESSEDELTVLEKKYQQELALLERYGFDATRLTEQYQRDREAIIEKWSQQVIADMRKEVDDIADLSTEELRKFLADQKAKEERAKLTRDTLVASASNALGSIASLLGEETAAGKAAAVAQATINTYQAANGAYASLASIPVVGPGLGAAAAAAAILAGIANVKKILSVDPKASGTASVPAATAMPAAPAVVIPDMPRMDMDYVRNVTTRSEDEELNRPVKAYVVESEATAAQQLAATREDESTF